MKDYFDFQYPLRDTPVKIIDGFTFAYELGKKIFQILLIHADLLEIRLHELMEVVDYHILVESPWDQKGNPKKLFWTLHKNEPRFLPFHHKVRIVSP